jgi:ribonuclease P protein component
MERMRQRADFLAAASGQTVHAGAFVLQARRRDDEGPARVGFTVSKKVGNAVERNRVRRRLREIVRLSALPLSGGHDYVLVGRRAALTLPFARMAEEFEGALKRVQKRRGPRPSQERNDHR